MNSRSRIEQETTITFNAQESEVILWTAWPPMQRKMKKFNIQPYRQEGDGKWYKITKNMISFRNPLRKRVLTEEQRKTMSEHGKRLSQRNFQSGTRETEQRIDFKNKQ